MEKKNLVVTGASAGIGRALVKRFLGMGHRVCGCARRFDLLAEFAADFPETAFMESVDVTSAEQVVGWAKRCRERFGVPEFVINNAAVINRNASFTEVPVEEFDRLIDINIKGVANVMRAFLPSMESRGRGVVINLSSGWGRSAAPEVAPYCCSKWAVEGLSKAVALEVGGTVSVIPLSPNMVNTDMLASCFGDGASGSPRPDDWARDVAPWILELGRAENGQSLSAPQ